MARVTGVGGIFLRARDPKALCAWYVKHLGNQLADYAALPSLDRRDTRNHRLDHMVALSRRHHLLRLRHQQAMVNYRVDDLDELLAQLKAADVPIDPKRDDYDFGRFAWITDPEGNRIELWQPLVPLPEKKAES